MAFKNVVFDLDGTLTDPKLYGEIYPIILERIKKDNGFNDEDVDDFAEKSGLKRYPNGRWDSGQLCIIFGLLDWYYELLDWYTTENIILYTDVEYLFRLIKKREMRIIIASNSMHRTIELFMDKYGLSQYVDIMFSSSDAGFKKDDARFWKELIERHKLKREETIIFGDEIVADFETPTSVGLKAVLIRRPEDIEKIVVPLLV